VTREAEKTNTPQIPWTLTGNGFDMSIGSIGNIGGWALAPIFAPRVQSFANDSSSDTAATQPSSSDCLTGGMCVAPPSQSPAAQSPGGLTDLSGLTVQESHLALRIRSRSELRTASDGTITERTSTKLRFHYDLTTADGQHVELNVKAKVRQVSVQDAAGNSVSKTQLKLQFSLLQEGVAEDLSPLQSDQVPSDTRSEVSDGLQAFLSAVGDALQDFVEGDNVSADDLVKRTVDTFNTLVDALTQLLFPTAESDAPPALPTGDESIGQIPTIDSLPLDDSEPSPPQPDVTSPPLLPAPEDAGLTGQPPPTDTLPAASGDVTAPGESASSEPPVPADQTTPVQSATQVLQSVRLRFVQSLTQIIRTLSPGERAGDSSSAAPQLLYYQNSLSLRIRTASLVDVDA